jgi:hypothetical protein
MVRIEADHRTCRTHTRCGFPGEYSAAARHIQHPLARLDLGRSDYVWRLLLE